MNSRSGACVQAGAYRKVLSGRLAEVAEGTGGNGDGGWVGPRQNGATFEEVDCTCIDSL
jgi:hypothetical protein